MVPFSLAQLLFAMIDRGRADLVDALGALYGRALLHCSERTLRWLERRGLSEAGWALVVVEMAKHEHERAR